MAPACRLSSSHGAFMVSSYSHWKGRSSTIHIANDAEGLVLGTVLSGCLHHSGVIFASKDIALSIIIGYIRVACYMKLTYSLIDERSLHIYQKTFFLGT
jgi:hypothetical protein